MRAAWTQPNPTDGSTQPMDNSGPVYVLDVKRQVGGENGVFEQIHRVERTDRRTDGQVGGEDGVFEQTHHVAVLCRAEVHEDVVTL